MTKYTNRFRKIKFFLKMAYRTYHNYWVYILTNKPNGTLYIGVTGGIDDRMERHLNGEGSKFTSKYNLNLLVYFEEFQYINDAIAKEKQLKNWHRQWKINLIEKENPNWINLWKNVDSETSSE
jgi:putative endonuclease